MRRPRTSVFLIICGLTLLASIFVGEKMGEHVLGKSTDTAVLVPEIQTPVPSVTASQSGPIVDWRREHVVTVATDPGFPDPRLTRPPTPTPKPTPSPTPAAVPTPFLFATATPQLPAPSPSTTTSLPPYAIPTPPPNTGG